MRKLIILKSLIDFVWIVTCIPGILICLFLAVYMFVAPESLNLFLDADDSIIETSVLSVQLFGLVFIVLGFVTIYCVYLFRKTLRYFQRVKPFHADVITNFYKIGYLLTGVGIIASVLIFLGQLVFTSQLKINLGLSPYLMLICLGLFFMVLSEVFKVAKKAKEENELTV
ncbi:DUF2975 domain-containing protein [Winogradskyella sediminis]|uniref:DUF2975 domain-containing protein n=1 Tax=Winogradskyella sediminis TaxID=1382466 RepID=A0A1H1SYK9_9FLAO|nr:DUF2975 domain-containing protein [Winogradskyella sediminis]REG89122.1 hypothetical protein C8N41_101360 [Winogradskyella sediminis]SDS53085.1 Protein of unknown function [Winogradskyella sediminis]